MSMQTHPGAVEQTQETLDGVVQLQHMLHKMPYLQIVGLLDAILDIESQIVSRVMWET